VILHLVFGAVLGGFVTSMEMSCKIIMSEKTA